MHKIARGFHFIYALLLIVGGFMGYIKASSTPSLLMGCLFGCLFLISFFSEKRSCKLALNINLYGSLILSAFFLFRFSLAWSWFPAGLMFILSLVMLIRSYMMRSR